MLYVLIENARGEREKSPLLRGGLRRTVSCSDVARIILGSFSDRPRIPDLPIDPCFIRP